MISSKDDVLEMYERTADSYAKMMDAEIALPVYGDVLARLARRLEGIPGPVLDTSCGSGHMLQMYRDEFDSQRQLIGLDLSPRMVALSRDRLGPDAVLRTGDMRDLGTVEAGSAAAVVSFFALHHLDPHEVQPALVKWHRALRAGGQLLIATWEGQGHIDYGTEADIVAHRYSQADVEGWVEAAGFTVDRCVVDPVEGFPMDAVYLEASRG